MSGVLSTLQVHSCLANFDATGYHHLGAGSKESSACKISQAHLINMPKIILIFNKISSFIWIFFTKLEDKTCFKAPKSLSRGECASNAQTEEIARRKCQVLFMKPFRFSQKKTFPYINLKLSDCHSSQDPAPWFDACISFRVKIIF